MNGTTYGILVPGSSQDIKIDPLTGSSQDPGKHAGSDPEAFWLRPACSQNRAG